MSDNVYVYFGEFVSAAKQAKWPKERVMKVIEDARGGDNSHALEVLFAAYLEMEVLPPSSVEHVE